MTLFLLAALPWLAAAVVACLPAAARRTQAGVAGAAALGVTAPWLAQPEALKAAA